nr:hypothetical protein I308_00587 [Cryptococcus tetragattii IND107]
MTKLIGAFVVLGVAQSCWYDVYLESPYDYYFRYCSSGCANLAMTDDNFSSCCLPFTSGQSTPVVCTSLSLSYAAMGTTCTWGDVSTTDAPTSTPVDSTYTPPPYIHAVTSAQASATDDCSTEESDDNPDVATETSWVTSTTTTPCSTTSAVTAPAPSDESCNCGGESGQAAESSNWEGNTLPASFTADNRRRDIMRRGSCECSAISSSLAETSAAAVATSVADTSHLAITSFEPAVTSSGDSCNCGKKSGQAAESTNWEGNTAPSGFTPDNRRRGRDVMKRGDCDCGEESSEDGARTSGIVASSYVYEGNTAPTTFAADNRRRVALKPRNIALANFNSDNRKRGYKGIVRGASVGGKPENEKRKYDMVHDKEVSSKDRRSPDHHSNVAGNAERKIPTAFSRYYDKRDTPTTTIHTSTTWVTTADCGTEAVATSAVAETDINASATASNSSTDAERNSSQAGESISATEDTESASAITGVPSTSVPWEGSGPPSSFMGDNRKR